MTTSRNVMTTINPGDRVRLRYQLSPEITGIVSEKQCDQPGRILIEWDNDYGMTCCLIDRLEVIERPVIWVAKYTKATTRWVFDGRFDLRACFPDDPDGLQFAMQDILNTDEHICGGGAQPIVHLVAVRQ